MASCPEISSHCRRHHSLTPPENFPPPPQTRAEAKVPQRHADDFAGNVGAATQVRRLTTGLQRAALTDSRVPLLIATEQEGGRVQRLTHGVTDRPAQQRLAHLSPAALTCSYFTLGSQLRALGINQDFAPVADVVRTRTGCHR